MFIRYVVLFCKVLGVHLYLYQREPYLFVTVNDTAEISCFLTANNLDGGHKVLWFWRGTEETVTFIMNCHDNKSDGKYHCRSEPRSATLEIYSAQRNESGVYYCAYPIVTKLKFAEGSALIVGDSYTAKTSVELVNVPLKQNVLTSSDSLACVVRAVSGPVWLSWNISGRPSQRKTSLTRDVNGTFTFISHIPISSDNWTRGEVSCNVQFNSSQNVVTRTATYRALSDADVRRCTAPLVSGILLLLLTLSVTLYRLYQTSDKGMHHSQSVATGAQKESTQGDILYADLDFETKNPKKNRHQGRLNGKKKYSRSVKRNQTYVL
ncbi:hypothetical protein NDU88_001089 [Pleurodeles waltl]|uniref:Ig-like domain-containing protein n=1 Tax=Pleurodeles waltl TaxID=8319 RepID=A0AAV7KZT6_PLEWA|nr:hypothetical protein NDU88_001089 [Pleurodeles waltl]